MPAPFCSITTCSKKTIDPSVLCYLHRYGQARAIKEGRGHLLPMPGPVTEVRWVPGEGPHQVGGYSEVIVEDDFRTYSLNGKAHRVDGPAKVWRHGHEEWWLDGQKHRESGPAVQFVDRHQEHYLHGQRYRLDGPAVDYSDTPGYVEDDDEFFVFGTKLTREDFGRFREALDGGAPLEWALAYIEGATEFGSATP